MNEHKYTIGLDYGSLSCRAVLVDARSGSVRQEVTMDYPHGVIESSLPDGTPLQGLWSLQHPGDYTLALETLIPELLEKSAVDPNAIAGIGVDFTASTVVPLDKDFIPLCLSPRFASRPHAWVKLWKHHGALKQAQVLTQVCQEHHYPYLDWYGGKISAECLTAKLLQVYDEDREVYDAADCFIEAGDYITSLLVGHPAFGVNSAGTKAFWDYNGYPDDAFWQTIDPGLKNPASEKLMDHFPLAPKALAGEKVGTLCSEMAAKLGLSPGIAVSAMQLDAYAAMPGVGLTESDTALLVVGTSTGLILLSDRRRNVPGVTACLEDMVYAGLWGYGSGQAAVGDMFQWFVDNALPGSYAEAAKAQHLSPHSYLTHLAQEMEPGDSGLIALDWFNGNRSPLANGSLCGMIVGLQMNTRPEHVYRALLEASAFGMRAIFDTFAREQVPVNHIVACGGIAVKNSLLMQMYADVLRRPILVSSCTQAPALGAAIFAASAAGLYPTVKAAVQAMGCREGKWYYPDPNRSLKYQELYQQYLTLSDYFGLQRPELMETLRTSAKSLTGEK